MKPIHIQNPAKNFLLSLLRARSGGLLACVCLLFCATGAAQSQPSSHSVEVIGTWEGESKCVVPDSPCHDEHVIYEITEDKSTSGGLKIDGYKLVNGDRQLMGTLRCEYESAKKNLSCTSRNKNTDDWEYILSGNSMKGTLTLDAGKRLYREITLKKRPAQ